MKHLFIVNPVAGKGKSMKFIPKIKSYCNEHNLDYEIIITDHPGHATEIAKSYSSNYTRIYSVGGDGTLNEVLNGMAGGNSSLAVIPAGSGNDFIRSIVGKNIPDNILDITIKGTERLIDYASINGRYFLNIASFGFDAEVVYQANHFKKFPAFTGEMAYMLGILTAILFRKNYCMELKIDDKIVSGETLLIAVGIGKYYGGGMKALPDALLDDGLFDVCFVDAVPKLKILRFFPVYMKGRHGAIKDVHFYRGKSIEITADKPIPMNHDGEVTLTEKAVFEIFPKSLPFVVPAGY